MIDEARVLHVEMDGTIGYQVLRQHITYQAPAWYRRLRRWH